MRVGKVNALYSFMPSGQ